VTRPRRRPEREVDNVSARMAAIFKSAGRRRRKPSTSPAAATDTLIEPVREVPGADLTHEPGPDGPAVNQSESES
jgi:hypothetical protein